MRAPTRNRIRLKLRYKRQRSAEFDTAEIDYEKHPKHPKQNVTPSMERRIPIVSDHAMIRWLERYLGVDMAQVKACIVGDGRAELIRAFRSGRFPVGDGFKLVVEDGVVITVVGPEE